ncbi:hypothetical protein [Caballeronia sp. 15711]|uniref:hypothetical protein n=1 Tax=Caballeronia sp. 15711 TaxID=3391029 RepID=UPI0039E57B3D
MNERADSTENTELENDASTGEGRVLITALIAMPICIALLFGFAARVDPYSGRIRPLREKRPVEKGGEPVLRAVRHTCTECA